MDLKLPKMEYHYCRELITKLHPDINLQKILEKGGLLETPECYICVMSSPSGIEWTGTFRFSDSSEKISRLLKEDGKSPLVTSVSVGEGGVELGFESRGLTNHYWIGEETGTKISNFAYRKDCCLDEGSVYQEVFVRLVTDFMMGKYPVV